MAEAIRQQEDLLAMRLDLKMTDKGMRVVADAFRGDALLGNELRFPLADLGYDPQGRPIFRHGAKPPTRLVEAFDTVRKHAARGEPVWLQIAYGAELLAAYPWEDVFGQVVERQILRIPNFFRSGYQREPDRPIAICAATPVAKGAPDWSEPVRSLLASLNDGRARNVVLFVDARSRDGLPSKRNFPNLHIHVAPPPERVDAPARETAIVQRSEISNPWLAWIAETLGPSGAHAVHVLCPGFSREARGALAFPESPLGDGDPQWARFVGVEEFARFADRIDARATGISALGNPVWAEGVRLFANELGWVRPGPVIADFGGSDGAALDAAYGLLLGQKPLTAEPMKGLVLSIHPALLHEDGGAAAVRSIARAPNLEAAVESVDFEARLDASSGAVPREVSRAIDQLSSARPRSPVETARERGMIRAMEFVAVLARDGGIEK